MGHDERARRGRPVSCPTGDLKRYPAVTTLRQTTVRRSRHLPTKAGVQGFTRLADLGSMRLRRAIFATAILVSALATMGPSNATSRPRGALGPDIACRVIDYTRTRKLDAFDFTAVIRLVNRTGRSRRVVGRWSVEGRRLVIRAGRDLEAHQARTVTRSVGHASHHPTMNLLSCRSR
jgi:hypothetical protein